MTIPRFRPPQQTRSQETLDRILDAAERVLDEKSFTEATLAEIMERAGVTVGAFYRRFPDKDALLHLLDERFFHEMQDRAGELLDPKHWRGASIAEILSEFSRTAVDVYSTRRGVARSLFLRARVDPVIQATARQVNARCIELLRALLLDPIRRAEITHPDPERALALGPLSKRVLSGKNADYPLHDKVLGLQYTGPAPFRWHWQALHRREL